MKKVFLLLLFVIAAIGFASAKQATSSPPTLPVANDEFNVLPASLNFMSFMQMQNGTMITAIGINTHMVLPAYINFSQKSSAIGSPITTTEELCAKKDLFVANYSINTNDGKQMFIVGSTSYNLKHPVLISANKNDVELTSILKT